MPPDTAHLVLALETSNPSSWQEGTARPGVAIGEIGPSGVLAGVTTEPLDTLNPRHDDLQSCIDRAMASRGATPRDIARVCVSVGPGGFTNIRIAVTTARMIAEVTGAACVPVPSAIVVARRAKAPGPFVVALASKGETAYVTVFSNPNTPDAPGSIMDGATIASLAQRGVRLLVADQFLPPVVRIAVETAGMAIRPPVFDPVACLEAGLTYPAVDPVALRPIYPREPEAVTKWRALKRQ